MAAKRFFSWFPLHQCLRLVSSTTLVQGGAPRSPFFTSLPHIWIEHRGRDGDKGHLPAPTLIAVQRPNQGPHLPCRRPSQSQLPPPKRAASHPPPNNGGIDLDSAAQSTRTRSEAPAPIPRKGNRPTPHHHRGTSACSHSPNDRNSALVSVLCKYYAAEASFLSSRRYLSHQMRQWGG